MELLAPAGSIESLKAAIYAGANAVYLGGKKFNARANAANFTLEELKIACDLAHDYNVRVYLTVNTLTHEQELIEMGNYLCEVANCGVDAFIVQDLGVAKLASKVAPQVELHASTQMTIHSAEALPLLIENNFKRVVLAREVELASIKKMHEEYPQIGLEVFVHGALCYAYSGQCLMSSIIGGRSGNRGACAGPCRLPYTLMKDGIAVKTNGNYLMSPKDLCLIEHLPILKKYGASALKIEGRLKRPDYVYTVVSRYREALNKTESYHLSKSDNYQLKQAFNRGFTKGLILGEKAQELMNIDRPDNRGVEVAVVKDCYKGKLKIKCLTNLLKGDIIAWHDGKKTQTLKLPKDYNLGSMIAIKTNDNVKIGDKVTRVVSIEQQRKVTEAMRRPFAKFALNITANLTANQPLEITAIDSNGYQVTVLGEKSLEPALNKIATEDYVCSQLGKLGGTMWYLAECNVKISGNPAVRAAELNKCRRQLITKLMAKKHKKQHQNPNLKECNTEVLEQLQYQKHPTKQQIQKHPKLAVSTQTLSEAKAALNVGADLVYLGSETFHNLSENELQELSQFNKHKLVLRLPRITEDKDFNDLINRINYFTEFGINSVLVDNLGQLNYLKNKQLKLISGSGIPVFNALTIKELKKQNVSRITFSPELNYKQILELVSFSDLPIELVIHGRILLMIHKSCILSGLGSCNNDCVISKYSLKDRKNYQFPLVFDNSHRSYLYNCQDLALYNKIPELFKLNASVLRIEASGRGEQYVINVVQEYQQLLQKIDNFSEEDCVQAYNNLIEYSEMGLTKAHWQRGV